MKRTAVALLLLVAWFAILPSPLKAQDASPEVGLKRPSASTPGIPGIFAFLIRDFFSEAWRSPDTYTRATCDAATLLALALVFGKRRRTRP